MPKFKKPEDSEEKPKSLEAITFSLGEADVAQKVGKKDRDKLKDEFFALINEKLKAEDRARKVFKVSTSLVDRDAVDEYAALRNPGWLVLDVALGEGDAWEVQLEEDPAFMPFVFVNPLDEKVYARSVRDGSLMLDDERLKEDDFDLYDEVTYVPGIAVIEDFLSMFGDHGMDEHLYGYAEDNPDKFPRVLRPLGELTEEQIADLGPYIYESKKTTALNAPRKAKPEELD